MKFHIRKIDHKMNESKYNLISFDKNEGVIFNNMYHFIAVENWYWCYCLSKSALLLC